MLTRLYADNFRCLVNFELLLDETNVLLDARPPFAWPATARRPAGPVSG